MEKVWKKVWIVLGTNSYYDIDVIGVCSSEELAKKVIELMGDDREFIDYDIEEYTIDSFVETRKALLKDEIRRLHEKETLLNELEKLLP